MRRTCVFTITLVGLALVGIALCSQFALAASFSSIPSADTSTYGAFLDTAYGADPIMSGGWAGSTGYDAWYWTTQVLWALPGDLAGATINSASITLPLRYGINSDPTKNPVPVGLQAYTKAWDEATATYRIAAGPADFWTGASAGDGQSGFGGGKDRVLDGPNNKNFDIQQMPAVAFVSENAAAATVVFDAKTLVEYWADGNANYGAAFRLLEDLNGGSQFFTYWAREFAPVGGSPGDLAPVLSIDYTPIPEPTSLVLLGLGCLSIVLRRPRD